MQKDERKKRPAAHAAGHPYVAARAARGASTSPVEEAPKANKPQKRTIVVVLIMAVMVVVMGFSGFKLWEIDEMYRLGQETYEQMANQARNPGNTATSTEALVEIPDFDIDFAALADINEDTVAWLYGPNTPIDYPVMKATEYDYYLRHLPDGTYNANGTLFLDYNNPPDFSGRLNIIYGHGMDNGAMFGSLLQYKNQAYFEEHPYLYLYTRDSGNFRVDLVYGCVIEAGQWRDQAFMYEVNLPALLSHVSHNTTFTSAATYSDTDRFLVLSTCSYEFNDARYIAVGVLRPQFP